MVKFLKGKKTRIYKYFISRYLGHRVFLYPTNFENKFLYIFFIIYLTRCNYTFIHPSNLLEYTLISFRSKSNDELIRAIYMNQQS